MDSFVAITGVLSPILVAIIGRISWKKVKNLQDAQANKENAAAEEAESSAAESIKTAALDLLKPYREESEKMRERIAALEEKVEQLTQKIEEYRESEKNYERLMDAKDLRIEELSENLALARIERDRLKIRVAHLEEVCRKAGINGEDT